MTRGQSSPSLKSGLKPGLASGVALAAALIVLLVVGLSSFRAAGANDAEMQATPMPVQVIAARYSDGTQIEERFPALIQAKRQSMLGFERGGRVERLHVDVGDQVEAGQVLAQLDVRAVDAQIQAARAQVNEARAQRQLAQVTLERQRRLVEQGHISPQRLDEASANADAAAARAAAALASLETLQVQRDLAHLQAPFDGVITARTIDEGAIAGPGAGVFEIVEHAALEAIVGLPIEEASELVVGEPYGLEINGEVMSVTFRATTGVVDRQTRVVSTVFDIPDDVRVPSGAIGRLVLNHGLYERGMWVPISALLEGRRGLWTVYLAEARDGDHRVSARTVEILHTEGERVYIRGAVDEGSLIIQGGTQRVTPGQSIQIRRGEG